MSINPKFHQEHAEEIERQAKFQKLERELINVDEQIRKMLADPKFNDFVPPEKFELLWDEHNIIVEAMRQLGY